MRIKSNISGRKHLARLEAASHWRECWSKAYSLVISRTYWNKWGKLRALMKWRSGECSIADLMSIATEGHFAEISNNQSVIGVNAAFCCGNILWSTSRKHSFLAREKSTYWNEMYRSEARHQPLKYINVKRNNESGVGYNGEDNALSM